MTQENANLAVNVFTNPSAPHQFTYCPPSRKPRSLVTGASDFRLRDKREISFKASTSRRARSPGRLGNLLGGRASLAPPPRRHQEAGLVGRESVHELEVRAQVGHLAEHAAANLARRHARVHLAVVVEGDATGVAAAAHLAPVHT